MSQPNELELEGEDSHRNAWILFGLMVLLLTANLFAVAGFCKAANFSTRAGALLIILTAVAEWMWLLYHMPPFRDGAAREKAKPEAVRPRQFDAWTTDDLHALVFAYEGFSGDGRDSRPTEPEIREWAADFFEGYSRGDFLEAYEKVWQLYDGWKLANEVRPGLWHVPGYDDSGRFVQLELRCDPSHRLRETWQTEDVVPLVYDEWFPDDEST